VGWLLGERRTQGQLEDRNLLADAEEHLQVNGLWQYTLSQVSYEPVVTAAVEKILAEDHLQAAVRAYQSHMV
jgi:hypothetical protein